MGLRYNPAQHWELTAMTGRFPFWETYPDFYAKADGAVAEVFSIASVVLIILAIVLTFVEGGSAAGVAWVLFMLVVGTNESGEAFVSIAAVLGVAKEFVGERTLLGAVLRLPLYVFCAVLSGGGVFLALVVAGFLADLVTTWTGFGVLVSASLAFATFYLLIPENSSDAPFVARIGVRGSAALILYGSSEIWYRLRSE